MKTATIKGLGILLFNAKRDLARQDGDDTWGPRVWDQARNLYCDHGAALIDALIADGSESAKRLADSLLATSRE